MLVANGGLSASGRHFGWPHFRNPEMSSSKMAAGSRRAAIYTTTTMGIEKFSPGLGWHHFRRRNLGIKMAAPLVTSRGRRDSHEEVPSSERGGPSPKTSRRRLKLFFLLFYRDSKKHLIVSLPQPFSQWLRELPACHYGEVDQSAHVNTTFHEMWCWLRQASTLLFLTVFYNIRELL